MYYAALRDKTDDNSIDVMEPNSTEWSSRSFFKPEIKDGDDSWCPEYEYHIKEEPDFSNDADVLESIHSVDVNIPLIKKEAVPDDTEESILPSDLDAPDIDPRPDGEHSDFHSTDLRLKIRKIFTEKLCTLSKLQIQPMQQDVNKNKKTVQKKPVSRVGVKKKRKKLSTKAIVNAHNLLGLSQRSIARFQNENGGMLLSHKDTVERIEPVDLILPDVNPGPDAEQAHLDSSVIEIDPSCYLRTSDATCMERELVTIAPGINNVSEGVFCEQNILERGVEHPVNCIKQAHLDHSVIEIDPSCYLHTSDATCKELELASRVIRQAHLEQPVIEIDPSCYLHTSNATCKEIEPVTIAPRINNVSEEVFCEQNLQEQGVELPANCIKDILQPILPGDVGVQNVKPDRDTEDVLDPILPVDVVGIKIEHDPALEEDSDLRLMIKERFKEKLFRMSIIDMQEIVRTNKEAVWNNSVSGVVAKKNAHNRLGISQRNTGRVQIENGGMLLNHMDFRKKQKKRKRGPECERMRAKQRKAKETEEHRQERLRKARENYHVRKRAQMCPQREQEGQMQIKDLSCQDKEKDLSDLVQNK